MTIRLLIATLAALSILGAGVADAAQRKHKRQKVVRHHAPVVMQGPALQAYPGHPPTRPAWTRGTECYTDDGYGRFLPCDLAKSF